MCILSFDRVDEHVDYSVTCVLYDCVCSNGQYVVAGSDDGCAV